MKIYKHSKLIIGFKTASQYINEILSIISAMDKR